MSLTKQKKCNAYRNIPTAYQKKYLFNEEINSGEDQDRLMEWANVTSGIGHRKSSAINNKDTWYHYGDLENHEEFLFSKVELPKPRFSDGTFPVWYGAEDLETSLMEIEFHLKIDTEKEIQSGHIDFERAMCVANLDMMNHVEIKEYHHQSSYGACTKIFHDLIKQGATSLTYESARNQKKECYALTDKKEILSSKVIQFFRLRVYADAQKTTDVADIFLEG